MLFGLQLGGLLTLWLIAAERCNEEVTLCTQSLGCHVFASLTRAVEAAPTHQYAEITFQRQSLCEWALDAVTLPPHTDLRISNATVIIRDIALIRANASLELLDTALSVEANGELVVEGLLKLFNACIQGCAHAAIVANGGGVEVHSSIFLENFAVFAITSQGTVSVEYSTFVNNSGLLLGELSASVLPVSIYFLECSFEKNKGESLLRIAKSALETSVSLSIIRCSFHFNSALLFDLRVQGITVKFQSNTFSHNSGGGLRLIDSVASVYINGTHWTNNYNRFVWVEGLFSGTVEIINSAMSYQATRTPFFIKNEGSHANCTFAIFNVEMSHFYVESPFGEASTINSETCTLSISNAIIKNCTNYATMQASGISLMFLASGSATISNVSITDSGGSGVLIVVLFCSAMIETVRVTWKVVQSPGVIIAIGSSIQMFNVVFEGREVRLTQGAAQSLMCLFYAEMSTLAATNLTASGFDFSLGGAVLGGYVSSITCNSLRIFNASANVAISQLSSDIRITDIDCDLCRFLCFAASAGRYSVKYSRLRTTHSSFPYSLFCFGSGGNISVSTLSLSDSQAGGVISAFSSIISLDDWEVYDCQVSMLLKDMILSQVSIARVKMRNVEGGFLSASNSAFQITDCLFTELSNNGDFISLSMSTLDMRKSDLNVISTRGIIRVLKGSILSLYECRFSDLRATKSAIIEVVDSSFSSIGTSYFGFNPILIGSVRSPVILFNSSIESGGPGYRIGSVSDFGGVLSCVDCPSINITNVNVANTSADLGGALYVASIEAASTLNIVSSQFFRCRAKTGGVMVLRNVSFHIIDSAFLNSSAEVSGGALDICIRFDEMRVIERCSFVGNSAVEGGAVKWHNAQPYFVTTEFSNNSAVYGADIASYGSQIAVLTAQSSVAPGQRTNISFELLDHYGAQVTTANHQLLVLHGTGEVSIKGISHKVAQAGVFNFTGIEFLAPPDSNQTVLSLCNITSIDSFMTIKYLHTIPFRSCEVGEIARNTSCELCAQGYYSLRLDASNCSLCPSKAHCPGGNRIVLKPNAWRTSDLDNPVVDCVVEGRCDGAEANSCTEGYAGLLCGHCRDGWFPLVFSSCEKCPHKALIWIELVFAIAIRVVTVFAFIKLIGKSPEAGQLHALKVLILHVQIIAMLSYVQTRVPVEIAIFLHLMLTSVSMYTANFPFHCLERSYYYNAGIASLETPITILMILAYFFYMNITKRPSVLNKHNIARVLILWSYLQSGVALMAVLPGFSCMNVASSEWLAIDMAQQCWTNDHLNFIAYVAAPSLSFNVVLPLLLFLVVYRQLSPVSECMHLFWEVFLRCWKLISCFCMLAQATTSQSSQLFVGLLFLYFESVLNSVVVQYRSQKSLCLVQGSGFVSIASYSVMLYFPEGFGYRIAASVFFMVINLGFAVTAVTIALRGYNEIPIEVPHDIVQHQSMDSLVPPNNSVVSEKGIQIILEEAKGQ